VTATIIRLRRHRDHEIGSIHHVAKERRERHPGAVGLLRPFGFLGLADADRKRRALLSWSIRHDSASIMHLIALQDGTTYSRPRSDLDHDGFQLGERGERRRPSLD
jgi:hypothetical protein